MSTISRTTLFLIALFSIALFLIILTFNRPFRFLLRQATIAQRQVRILGCALLGLSFIPSGFADSVRPVQAIFHFATNQAQVSIQDRAVLEQHGQFIAEHPEIRVVLHGHSDTRCNSLRNARLALNRAQAVAQILREQGVALEQIEIVSWGALVPAGESEQSADDRRVELDYNDEFLANVGLDAYLP